MTVCEFLTQLAEKFDDGTVEGHFQPLALLCRDYAMIAVDGPEKPDRIRYVRWRRRSRREKKRVAATIPLDAAKPSSECD